MLQSAVSVNAARFAGCLSADGCCRAHGSTEEDRADHGVADSTTHTHTLEPLPDETPFTRSLSLSLALSLTLPFRWFRRRGAGSSSSSFHLGKAVFRQLAADAASAASSASSPTTTTSAGRPQALLAAPPADHSSLDDHQQRLSCKLFGFYHSNHSHLQMRKLKKVESFLDHFNHWQQLALERNAEDSLPATVGRKAD